MNRAIDILRLLVALPFRLGCVAFGVLGTIAGSLSFGLVAIAFICDVFATRLQEAE